MTSFTFVLLVLVAILPVVLIIWGIIWLLGWLFRIILKLVPPAFVTAIAFISLMMGIIGMLYIVLSGTAAILMACLAMALVIWGVYALLNRTK